MKLPFNYCSTIILISTLLQNAKALQCYECSTENDENCRYMKNRTTANTIACPENGHCLTFLPPTIGAVEHVKRGCYKSELCDNLSVCYVCDEALCNSSNKGAMALPFVIFTVLFACCQLLTF